MNTGQNRQRTVKGLLIALTLTAFTAGGVVLADVAAKVEPRIALGGHCPVSYQTESKAVKGDPAHAVPFQGWVYHCASADAKKTFEANPGKYAAQFGELCTTALGGSYGNRIPSDPTVFYVIDGKLYLFSSLRARNAFDRAPPDYIAKADKLYESPSFSGYSVPSYQLDNKAEKGDPKYRRLYRGLVYHFTGEDAAKAFEKEPERFLPKYDGNCAEGASKGKQFPADPKLFSVVDGKTYLFFDAKAKTAFDAEPKAMIEKADNEWEKLVQAGKKNPNTKSEP